VIRIMFFMCSPFKYRHHCICTIHHLTPFDHQTAYPHQVHAQRICPCLPISQNNLVANPLSWCIVIGHESMFQITMRRPKFRTFHDSPVIGDARQAGGVVALAPISNTSKVSTMTVATVGYGSLHP
jgi:hypothetical protein